MSLRRSICLAMGLLAAGAPLTRAQEVYTQDDLMAMEKALAQKTDAAGLATQTIKKYATDYSLLAYRKQSGQAELHEKFADFYVALEGNATLVSGGELVNSKTTAVGEVRADSIKGGKETKVGKGDIVHIPANIPHQLVLNKGETFQYFVVKVQEVP